MVVVAGGEIIMPTLYTGLVRLKCPPLTDQSLAIFFIFFIFRDGNLFVTHLERIRYRTTRE